MRLHHIALGAAAGLGIGFFTFFLFGAFEKGSIAAKVFWGLHWPEIVTVDWLTMRYYPHNTDQSLRFLVPVHLGYWVLPGVLAAVIYALARRAQERSKTNAKVGN